MPADSATRGGRGRIFVQKCDFPDGGEPRERGQVKAEILQPWSSFRCWSSVIVRVELS
jgi:hypothetical protein